MKEVKGIDMKEKEEAKLLVLLKVRSYHFGVVARELSAAVTRKRWLDNKSQRNK